MKQTIRRFAKTSLLTLIASGLLTSAGTAQVRSHLRAAPTGGSCVRCDLSEGKFGYKVLSNLNFSGAQFRGADFTAITMDRTNLARADLSEVNAYAGRFIGANFSEAKLDRASFTGGYLGRSDLTGASLTGTNFSGTDLRNVRGLTQAQLDAACGDRFTRLSGGLTIAFCS